MPGSVADFEDVDESRDAVVVLSLQKIQRIDRFGNGGKSGNTDFYGRDRAVEGNMKRDRPVEKEFITFEQALAEFSISKILKLGNEILFELPVGYNTVIPMVGDIEKVWVASAQKLPFLCFHCELTRTSFVPSCPS